MTDGIDFDYSQITNIDPKFIAYIMGPFFNG